MDLEGEDAEEEGGPERAVSARWQLIPSALRVSVAPVPFRSLNGCGSGREGLSEE